MPDLADDRAPEGQHYFTATPAVGSAPGRVTLALPDLTVKLATDRGVFSGARVDPGTRFLLLDAPPPPSGPVDLLDLGCGYGPLAVVLAKRSPEARIWAVDVNERALDLCRRNADSAGVGDRVRVALPDDVPADVRFAGIWSNPPIRVGKAALHDLLRRWLARLAPNGEAVLVVQKHLGADSLARWLADEGWPTRRLAARAGYRLLGVEASRPPAAPAVGPRSDPPHGEAAP